VHAVDVAVAFVGHGMPGPTSQRRAAFRRTAISSAFPPLLNASCAALAVQSYFSIRHNRDVPAILNKLHHFFPRSCHCRPT
jgi:hypothetical protein